MCSIIWAVGLCTTLLINAVLCQITEDDFDICPQKAKCAYLQINKDLVLTSSCENSTEFCAKVQITPMKSDPCRHRFDLAAIRANATTWVGFAISADSQMLHDYAFYCYKNTANLGLIVRRDPPDRNQPIVNSQNEDWRPNPEIVGQQVFKKMKNSAFPGKYFIQCSMRTYAFHWVHKQFPMVILGSGYDKIEKKTYEYTLHMASGMNSGNGKENLYVGSYHSSLKGSNDKILNEIKAPPAYRERCAASSCGFSFYLLIFMNLSICYFYSQL